MTEHSKLVSRFALSAIVLAAVSGVLWFVKEGPLRVNVIDIDPDGYTGVVAILSGVLAGLIAILVAVVQRVKRRRYSKTMIIALFLGLPALGWSAHVWWIFISFALSCAEGPCY